MPTGEQSEHLDRIREPEHLGAWLTTTARREALRLIQLRRRDVRQAGTPFQLPGGAFVPYLAIVVLAWMLWHAKLIEMLVVLGLLVVAALMFLFTGESRRAGRTVVTP